MKLLFDLKASQPNDSGASHGGGKYAIVVFFELLKRNVPLECIYDSRFPLREDVQNVVSEKNIKLHDLAIKSLDEIASTSGIDTYYSAYSGSKIVKGVRNIITVHGLRAYEMPRDWWMLRYKQSAYLWMKTLVTLMFNDWWKRKMLRRVRKLLNRPNLEFIVVSEHTKFSCLSCVPELDKDSVRVFYSPSTSTENGDVCPYTDQYKYVLLVSSNRSEKNALRAIVALDEIFSEHPELDSFQVLVTGSQGNGYIYNIKNKANFQFLGYVDEPTLESLYKGAYIFVYPSINEGFGYPPLEAMHYGVPVAASPISSISEVCGDAALYFNPFDYKEIKGRILRLLTDNRCHEDYSKRGLKRFECITIRQKKDLSALVDYIVSPTI